MYYSFLHVTPYIHNIYRPLQLVESPGTIVLRECLTLIRKMRNNGKANYHGKLYRSAKRKCAKTGQLCRRLKKEKREAEGSRREAQTTAEDAEERASDDELRRGHETSSDEVEC